MTTPIKKNFKFYNYVKIIRGENLTQKKKKKHNGYISNQTLQKGDIYLPDF